MKRYLDTLRLFVSTSLAAEMEYRVNFILASLVGLGQAGGAVFTLYLLCQPGYTPGGWTFDESLLVIGCFTLMQGLISTVLEINLSYLVRHVREGTLDFILVKPFDAQFWLSTRRFSPWGLPNMIYGLGLIIFGGIQCGLTIGDFAIGLLPLIFGMITLYSLWFILATSSIIFVRVTNITFVLSSLLDAGRFPNQAYPAGYQFFFKFIIPIAFLTTVPAQVMLGQDIWLWTITAGSVALGALVCSRIWWIYIQRHYTSASS